MEKLFQSIDIFTYYQTTWQNVASTINNRNAQEKGEFQVLRYLEQDLQKTGMDFTKPLFSTGIDRNFPVKL